MEDSNLRLIQTKNIKQFYCQAAVYNALNQVSLEVTQFLAKFDCWVIEETRFVFISKFSHKLRLILLHYINFCIKF